MVQCSIDSASPEPVLVQPQQCRAGSAAEKDLEDVQEHGGCHMPRPASLGAAAAYPHTTPGHSARPL